MTGFTPTAEQQDARDKFATGGSLVIEAGAGAGKTATLVLLAKDADQAHRRGQYIAFNKAIVTEAGEKMPANVACNTAHSLAYRSVMPNTRYPERLRNSARMKSTELADALRLDAIEVEVQDGNRKKLARTYLAGLVMRGITRFCQSADEQPDWWHVPYIDGIDIPPGNRANNKQVARALVPAMRRAWADITDEQGRLPFKHDHYLKMWHLSKPRINAGFILFDEAQDANPVLMDVVRQQERFGTQLIWVGDSQQQIYTFTGAENALKKVGAAQTAYLTQSFRFGPDVADVANDVLAMIPDAELRLTGTESIPSVVGQVDEPNVILCRTNARAVRHLLDYIEQGKRPHIVGGGKDVLDFAKAARDLMQDGFTSHPELACFDDWAEVQRYVAQDEQGGDLRLLVNLIDEFGVETIIEALDRMPREQDADIVLSTAHKAKGREWDRVLIADDFPAEPEGEELRLLYVAVTRARLALDITAVQILAGGIASPGEAASAAASIATDAPASVDGAEDEVEEPQATTAAAPSPAHVRPEAVQIALGELGEALMHDGEAAASYIERAIELLRSADYGLDAEAAPANGAAAPGSHSLAEHLAGVPGAFTIYADGRQIGTRDDSRVAIEAASAIYGTGQHRDVYVLTDQGELVVQYDA